MHYVVVLAGDVRHGEIVGTNTQERCDRALDAARHIVKDGSSVTLVVSAGKGSRTYTHHGNTVAELMREYLSRRAPKVPILYNEDRMLVWGTKAELEHALGLIDAAGADESDTISVVTNRRHMRRVNIIIKWFFNGRKVEEICSEDDPPPWWHEVLAYLKLCIMWTIPVMSPLVERFRHWAR